MTEVAGLDPRNRDFIWRPTEPPYRILTGDQARQFDTLGYVLIENAFAPGEIAAVVSAIDPYERHAEEALRAKGGRTFIARANEITFTIHLVKESAVLQAFSRHAVFQKLCHDIIGPGARLYWDQAVYKKPGNPQDFPWHQDNGYTFVEPQQYLTCWIPLTDATLDNGCPWIAPGYHRKGTLAHELTPLGLQCLRDPEGAVAVPAKAGDIVVFSSLAPHRTGPNLTRDVRKTYILQYAHDGAVVFPTGQSEGVPQNDPQRQYLVADQGLG